ncbi:MAG TPA: DNA mismatch repair protein MutS, partial [Clostridiales bacterium]|nr:DNA mismatch repair protein MutS [Clostridiales bacterium]
FATHYHELIAMEESFPGIVNYNVAAKKRGDGVTFLRKIVRGGTDDSYGIEVAKLAGVPAEVIRRAREILAEIESETPAPRQNTKTAEEPHDLFAVMANDKNAEVADKLRAADLNTMTPIEAMNLLYSLKHTLADGE